MLRRSFLFALLMSALSAQAAGQGGAPVEVAPLSAAVPEPASAPAAAEPAARVAEPATILPLAQTAAKRIEVLRAAVDASTPQRSFLSGLFSPPVRPVDTGLLAETDRYIERFPELPGTAQVYPLRAQLHQRIGNYPAAAMDWLMLLAAYPASPLAEDARKELKQLADGKLKKQAVTLQALIDKLGLLSGEREQRVAGFLVFAGRLSEKDFAAPVAAECTAFLARNRSYPEEDRILDALGRQQMQLDNETAVYYFRELQVLYPDSPLLPGSLLAVGNVQRNGLKRYADAAASFNTLIAKYPDSDEARQAYEALANMYDEDMRDYNSAIKTYDAIVARYKTDSVVLRSLQALARIYQDKTHQPLEAIATYRKLADIYKDKDGLAALLQAGKLARYTVSDWKLAIEVNRLIVNGYPKDDEAVKALYANANLYEDKLQDREQALKLYQEVVSNYPGHSLAKDARRHIDALQQKK